MKNNWLHWSLLATTSAFALMGVFDGPAAAAVGCTFNNVNGNIDVTTPINCVSDNNGTSFTGNITNDSVITPTHGYPAAMAGTASGISVLGSTTLNGNIVNNGTITGQSSSKVINIGGGAHESPSNIVNSGASVNGSITNNGLITGGTGINVVGSTVTGAITNSATGLIETVNVAIAIENGGTVGAIVNNGTINIAANDGIYVDAAAVTGSVTNNNVIAIGPTGSAAIVIANQSTVGGSVTNNGTITAKDNGMYISTSSVTGSFGNAGSIEAFSGMYVFGTAPGSHIGPGSVGGDFFNSGTITATSGTGMAVYSASIGGTFRNSGTITATGQGMLVTNYTGFGGGASTITGGIVNSGTVTTTGSGVGIAGIRVAGATVSNGINNSATGIINAVNGIGISLANSTNSSANAGPVSVTGGIVNSGTITAGVGIAVVGTNTVTGGIVNNGTIAVTGNIPLQNFAIYVEGDGPGATSVDSITNNGTMTGGGIYVIYKPITGTANTVIGGAITNNGTISAGSGGDITVSTVTVNGNIVNNGGMTDASTGAIQIINSGTINGSVINNGSITNTNNNGAAIYLFSDPGNAIAGETVTGSISNAVGGQLTGGYGIQVFATDSTAPTVIQGSVSNAGTITAAKSGMVLSSITVNGAVINSGVITATAGNGIQLSNFGAFTFATFTGGPAVIQGGVVNSGAITANAAGAAGILLNGAMVSNGITNMAGGKITATNGAGILATNVATFIFSNGSGFTNTGGPSSITGGIVNAGTITAKTGIMVTGGSTVAGGISNTGSLTGTRAAIDVTGGGAASIINLQSGSVSGSILLSSLADTVNISGGTFAGNIVGAGSANTVNFAFGSGSFSYAGNFTGINQVNFNSGMVTLGGTNTATHVAVAGGNLTVTGSVTGAMSVASGATLSGNGAVGATTVSSGGKLAPGVGTAPGTLTVNGNLTLSSGSTLITNVTQSAASEVSASGTANITGANLIANIAPGNYALGQQFTLVSSSGLTGTFGTVTDPFSTFVTPEVTYNADDAFLTFAQVSLTPLLPGNASSNDKNIAHAIDAAVANGGVPTDGFLTLYGLSGAALDNALTQLSGEISSDASQVAAQAFGPFLNLLMQTGDLDNNNGVTASAAPDGVKPAQLEAGTMRLWMSGYGGHSNFGANSGTGGQPLSAGFLGAAVGLESQVSDGLLIGGSLGTGGETFALGGGQSQGSSTDMVLGAYTRASLGHAYLAGALAYGWHNIVTERVISFVGPDILRGHFVADDFGGRGEAGYSFAMSNGSALTPYAAIAGNHFTAPAYAETALEGPSTLALSYASQDTGLVHSELGLRWGSDFNVMGDALSAELHAAWAHQLENNAFTQAAFQGLPGSSSIVTGALLPQDSANIGGSLEIKSDSGISGGGRLETQFGEGFTSITGTINIGYSW